MHLIFGCLQLVVQIIKKAYMDGCSFGCKNLFNFTYPTMKFHNCFHAIDDLQSSLIEI